MTIIKAGFIGAGKITRVHHLSANPIAALRNNLPLASFLHFKDSYRAIPEPAGSLPERGISCAEPSSAMAAY